MLHTLNLHDVICQLYLNKLEKNHKEKAGVTACQAENF